MEFQVNSAFFEQQLNELEAYIRKLENEITTLEAYGKKKDQEIIELRLASENVNFSPVRIDETIKKLEENKIPWIAFEYFPPKTMEGFPPLRERMLRMKRHKPVYVDVTWGAGGSSSDLTMGLCIDAQTRGLTANMHLTCTNMPRQKLDEAIVVAKKNNIVNLLALRGDPPRGVDNFVAVDTGFSCALDLIKFLREKTGNEFSITCSGYPEGHPDKMKRVDSLNRALTKSEEARVAFQPEYKDGKAVGEPVGWVCTDEDFQLEIEYLKQKVDAGAGLIVTQLFFDINVYFAFVDACRKAGISAPIAPGILCFANVGGFIRMSGLCKTRVPKELMESVLKFQSIAEEKEQTSKLREFAVAFLIDMCRAIMRSGKSYGLHFYTMNLDQVVDGVIAGLNLF